MPSGRPRSQQKRSESQAPAAYLDTSALIAFLGRSDTFHPLFVQLFQHPPKLLTTPLVIAEGTDGPCDGSILGVPCSSSSSLKRSGRLWSSLSTLHFLLPRIGFCAGLQTRT